MVLYPVLCIRKNIVYQRKCNLFTHVSTWITLLKIKYCYRSKYFHPEFIFFPLILKTTSKTEYALCKCLFSPLALLFFPPEILVCVWGGGEVGWFITFDFKKFCTKWSYDEKRMLRTWDTFLFLLTGLLEIFKTFIKLLLCVGNWAYSK